MPNETNKLVAKRSQIAGTAAIAIAILLGAFMFSQYRAQAAGVPAAPSMSTALPHSPRSTKRWNRSRLA